MQDICWQWADGRFIGDGNGCDERPRRAHLRCDNVALRGAEHVQHLLFFLILKLRGIDNEWLFQVLARQLMELVVHACHVLVEVEVISGRVWLPVICIRVVDL
jgi:hypothetical protein